MADEARTQVLERAAGSSPGAATADAPGDGGLDAGDSSSPQENDSAERERRKLQSLADKRAADLRREKAARAEAEAELQAARRSLEALHLDREMQAAEHDPDEVRRIALTREQTRIYQDRTETWLKRTLADFAEETGIEIPIDDERLELPDRTGWEAGKKHVLRRLERIRQEKAGGGTSTAPEIAALKAQIEELKSQLGLDRFDGGGGSSAGSGLTLEKYQAMTPAARTELRKKNPQAVNDMMRRASR